MKRLVLSTALTASLLMGSAGAKETSNFHKIEEKFSIIQQDSKNTENIEFYEDLKKLSELILYNDVTELEKNLFKHATENFDEYYAFLEYAQQVFKTGIKGLREIRKYENETRVKNIIKEIERISELIKTRFKELVQKAKTVHEFKDVFVKIKADLKSLYGIEVHSFWIPSVKNRENSIMINTNLDFPSLSNEEYDNILNAEGFINKKYSTTKYSFFTLA